MRKITCLLAAATIALLPHAGAARGEDAPLLHSRARAAEVPVVAGGGTPFSNGLFFPGTQLCAGATCAGEPYEIARGSDLRLYNLDLDVVANTHGILSDARRKNGAPLFFSDLIGGPASTVVKTSHLKPGVYGYSCRVHGAMRGLIEVTT